MIEMCNQESGVLEPEWKETLRRLRHHIDDLAVANGLPLPSMPIESWDSMSLASLAGYADAMQCRSDSDLKLMGGLLERVARDLLEKHRYENRPGQCAT